MQKFLLISLEGGNPPFWFLNMRKVCKKFCHYYKENKEDVGGCFPVKLLNSANLNYNEVVPTSEISDKLRELFCRKCDFFPDDCDFQLSLNPGFPCGGYVIERGVINIDEIKRLCEIGR